MNVWLQQFWGGLSGDFLDLPSGVQFGQIVGRLFVAAVLGGVLGYEREQRGKAAGLRTHMLVSLAAAFFIIVAQQEGIPASDLSRVIQGLAAGVGFLGAGTIIKQSENGQILGLTTAASLYFTTAIGIAAGMGREITAILGAALAMIVLTIVPKIEHWFESMFLGTRPHTPRAAPAPTGTAHAPPSTHTPDEQK